MKSPTASPEAEIAGDTQFQPPPPEIAQMVQEAEQAAPQEVASAKEAAEKGTSLWRKGDLDGAVTEWQKALKVCFSLACQGPMVSDELLGVELSVQLNLAAAALKREEAHSALHHCSRALQLSPGNPKGLYRTAKAHLLLNEMQEAEAAAAELLQRQPGDPDALALQRQIAREKQQHRRQEKQLLQRMMGMSPKSSNNSSSSNSSGSSSSSGNSSNSSSSSSSSSSNSNSNSSNYIWEVEWKETDRDADLWLRPHSLEFFSEECNFPLTRSLPLTLLSALQQLQQQQQQPQQGLPNLRKEVLCLHVLGATAQHEVSCRYTAILERWPKVKTLLILFVGFQRKGPNPTKFEENLVEGQLSPPHCVKLEGREQVAVFFSGTYRQLTEAVPGILSNSKCTFFPDLAVFSTLGAVQGVAAEGQPAGEAPRNGEPHRALATLPEDTLDDLRLLIDNNILTVVTESSICAAEDVAAYTQTPEARPLESSGAAAMQELGAHLLLPPTRSSYPLLLRIPSAAEAAKEASFAARRAAAAADAAAAAANRAQGKASPEGVAAAEATAKQTAADNAAAAAAADLAAAAAEEAAAAGTKEHVACAKHGRFFIFKGRRSAAAAQH